MNSRRHAFALAGALTATALTGAVAIAGLSHHPSTSTKSPTPQVVRVATAPAAPARNWMDD